MGNRKEDIHLAAAKLFREKGFKGSSVRDIANAVGIGAASLYNHMDSKEELLKTICFRCANEFQEGMERIEKSDLDPVQKIKSLIQLQIGIALHDENSLTVFNDEWRHLQEPYLSTFLDLRRQYEKRYLGIIEQGIETGLLRNADPYVLFHTILSALRWLHMPGGRKSKLGEQQLTEQITSIIINGIVV